MRPDSLAVLGLGAIGGSLAWQARLAGVASVVGYSPERGEAVQALRSGALTDLAETAERAVARAQLVVLAAPPDASLELLTRIAPHLASGALVTDVTSVKVPILTCARATGLAERFAGSHPLAGTHRSGWAAARADLFRDAVVYVSSTGQSGDQTAGQIMNFWSDVLQAHPVLIDPELHDRQLAWTSHLPQAVASALARCLASEAWLTGAAYGPGARDTTRLAASSPEMWVEVFLQNRVELLGTLDSAESRLAELRGLISAGDRAGLADYLAAARNFRESLEGSRSR